MSLSLEPSASMKSLLPLFLAVPWYDTSGKIRPETWADMTSDLQAHHCRHHFVIMSRITY
uniref:Uncharacterized protein n=1 Tax=Solanum lycopersicum TaxID=4081 RepID=A0A3Q7EMY7_SOLLC